jgi:hypothetical protein
MTPSSFFRACQYYDPTERLTCDHQLLLTAKCRLVSCSDHVPFLMIGCAMVKKIGHDGEFVAGASVRHVFSGMITPTIENDTVALAA